MARTKRAPSPDKEAKPHRRVWPPPACKERSLGKLEDVLTPRMKKLVSTRLFGEDGSNADQTPLDPVIARKRIKAIEKRALARLRPGKAHADRLQSYDKEGRLIENRNEKPTTLGELAKQARRLQSFDAETAGIKGRR